MARQNVQCGLLNEAVLSLLNAIRYIVRARRYLGEADSDRVRLALEEALMLVEAALDDIEYCMREAAKEAKR